ncbi:MAG: Mpo1-like protein [Xanthobacteraceae bacterium]
MALLAVRPGGPVSLNSAPHSALLRTAMSGIFHRQLAEYADYHRDQRNCLMHIIGNPILFVAAVLPLSLMSVTVFGVQTSAAPLLVIPALILWIAWDVGLGLAIVSAAIPLLLIAAIIANHVSVAAVWVITALLTAIGWALQIVGHQFFEQRRPALLDNPIHMLISPMYLFAKLFIALGFRRDLAALLQKSSA